MIFLIFLAIFIFGTAFGFLLGKRVVQKNAVLDAIIDATSKEVVSISDVAGFSIEHYPLTKRYYPKYKDKYLIKEYTTGIIKSQDDYLFKYSDHFDTEQKARNFIELAKEHIFKKNVHKIIV
jgi:hypothetical protein